MRSEDFKGILLTVLIILSLSASFIFLGNNSSEIVHASPDGEAGKPIEIKVKIFVLQNGPDWTDAEIDDMISDANEMLNNNNAGIKLVQGPLYRNFPGSVKTKEDRKAVRENVRENMKNEKFKGIALIMAKEGSIDDNPSCMGKAEKSDPAGAIVAYYDEKVWLHEIGHVLCLDDVDNENNIMNKKTTSESKGLSPEQIENMKKKAEKLNTLIGENNENRTPCTSAIDTIGDVKDKMTDNLAPDPGGIDIRVVNTPFLSPGTIDVEIISMSLMGRGDNLHLYYGLGLNTDDDIDTGGLIEGLPGYDRIVHIYLDYLFPFQPPEGSSEVWVYNVENDNLTYVGPAEIHTFVEIAELQGQGAGIQDNVDNIRDGVRARIPLDLLEPMAENVPAIAVAMDLDNLVNDTLTFICKTTVPPAPWMSISSRTGKPGDNVQIVGGGFPAESFFDVFVTLALGGTEVEVAHTAIDENGNFATTFEVPNLPPDDYFLTAIDSEFNLVFLMFTVEPIYGVDVGISPPHRSGLPGATLTYMVTVANAGNVSDTYTLAVTDNTGWGPVVNPTSLTVPPWENRTATLTVTLPSNARGCTEDNVTVTATGTGVSDSTSCIAHVTIVRGVEVSISPIYQTGLPGATLDYSVIVANTGNVPDTYDLTVSDNAGWTPTVTPTSLTVPPWENRTATLSVTVPPSAMGCTNDNMSVTATGTGLSDSDSCIAHATIVRGVDVSVSPSYQSGARGSALSYTVTITNTGNVVDNYDLTVSDNAGWVLIVAPTWLVLAPGALGNATLSVAIPENALGSTEDNIFVTAVGTEVENSASCIAHVRKVPLIIPATIDIDPNTLNLRSRGKWITAYIELPEGYSVENIEVSMVRLMVENKNVPAELKPISIGDQDNDGIADLMVKFDRAAVENLFPSPGAYTGTVTGQVAGIAFKGSDNIRVINPTRR